MNKEYIIALIIGIVGSYLYMIINKVGILISSKLMNSPSCLQYVVTTNLIVYLCWFLYKLMVYFK